MKFLYKNSDGSRALRHKTSSLKRFLAFASLCFTFQNMSPLISRVHAQEKGDEMGNGVVKKKPEDFNIKKVDTTNMDQVLKALEHIAKFKAGEQPKENLDKLRDIFRYWTDHLDSVKDQSKQDRYLELIDVIQNDHLNEREYNQALLESGEVKGNVAMPVGKPVKVKQLAQIPRPIIPVQPFEVGGDIEDVQSMWDVIPDTDQRTEFRGNLSEMTEAQANGDMDRAEDLGVEEVRVIEQGAPPPAGRNAPLTEDEQRIFGSANRAEVNAFKAAMNAGNIIGAINALPDDAQLKSALTEQLKEILKSGYKRSPMAGLFFGMNVPITDIKGVKISADLGYAATFARFQTAQLEPVGEKGGKKQVGVVAKDESITTISSLQAAVNAAMETWKGGELEFSVGAETISVGDRTVVQLVGKAKLTDASGEIQVFDVVFFPGTVAVTKVDPISGDVTLETSVHVVAGLAKVTGLPLFIVASVEGTPLARGDLPPLSQWEGKLGVNYGPYGVYGLVGTSAPDPLAAALKQEKKGAVWGGGARAALSEIFQTAYLPGVGLEVRVVDGRVVPFLNLQFQLGSEKGVE